MPAFVIGRELMFHEMPWDGSDSERRINLRIQEVEIFDELISSIALIWQVKSQTYINMREKHTVSYWPPDNIPVIDLAMEGFSATHKTRMRTTIRIWCIIAMFDEMVFEAAMWLSEVTTAIKRPMKSVLFTRYLPIRQLINILLIIWYWILLKIN